MYNHETKRVIMPRDIKSEEWKMTDSEETLKMFWEAHKEYFVLGTEKDNIPTSELEDKMPVNVTPDEGESVRPDENSDNSS